MSSLLHLNHITSFDLPALAPYRTLRRPAEHIKNGIFVAEGEKVVRRLLASSLSIVSALLTPEWLSLLQNEMEARGGNFMEVYIGSKNLLGELVGYNLHQGIMAVARVPADLPIGNIPEGHLLVALDGLSNSENTGVIVRNCAAFGVSALLVGEKSSSPYLRRAVRNSMGAVFHLPVIHVKHLADTLRSLRSTRGTRILGAHAHTKHELRTQELNGNVCLVFGSEESGISEEVLAACDSLGTIPMSSGIDSLNVASASAVVLYEAAEQRHSHIGR